MRSYPYTLRACYTTTVIETFETQDHGGLSPLETREHKGVRCTLHECADGSESSGKSYSSRSSRANASVCFAYCNHTRGQEKNIQSRQHIRTAETLSVVQRIIPASHHLQGPRFHKYHHNNPSCACIHNPPQQPSTEPAIPRPPLSRDSFESPTSVNNAPPHCMQKLYDNYDTMFSKGHLPGTATRLSPHYANWCRLPQEYLKLGCVPKIYTMAMRRPGGPKPDMDKNR